MPPRRTHCSGRRGNASRRSSTASRACAACALPGRGGGWNQSQDAWWLLVPSTCAAQATSTASLCASPMPTLSGESQLRLAMKAGAGWPVGDSDGSDVVVSALPSEPVFGPQQLPVLLGNSSHQKSTPLGIAAPVGARPITLSRCTLRLEVVAAPCGVHGGEPASGAGAHEIASGTAISIVPRRQLS